MEVKENEICFAKIRETAIIPTKKDEDAGYDLYADFSGDYFIIEPFKTTPVPTGIACAFAPKYYIQIEERSSMAKKAIKKSGGVMDSGYRGEYLIMLYNTNSVPFIISKVAEKDVPKKIVFNGKKYATKNAIIYPATKAICQMVLQEVPKLNSKEITYEELKQIASSRGAGGFGSSGK